MVEQVHLAASLHECSQNACCLLATPPTGYPDDPLEKALGTAGCSAPAAYSENAGSAGAWLYVECPLSLNLLFDVARFARAPYYARFSTSACLQSVLRPGQLIVEFDPTCDSCILDF